MWIKLQNRTENYEEKLYTRKKMCNKLHSVKNRNCGKLWKKFHTRLHFFKLHTRIGNCEKLHTRKENCEKKFHTKKEIINFLETLLLIIQVGKKANISGVNRR